MAVLLVPHTKNVFLAFGSSVEIKGKPAMPFNMFPEMQVDFHTGTDVDSDIAFHIRVYFGKYVVMNSRKGGKWGESVQSPVMPFENGQHFELNFSVVSKEYQVLVNGRQYYSFPHRLDPESVKMIQVWRDVSLTSVTVT